MQGLHGRGGRPPLEPRPGQLKRMDDGPQLISSIDLKSYSLGAFVLRLNRDTVGDCSVFRLYPLKLVAAGARLRPTRRETRLASPGMLSARTSARVFGRGRPCSSATFHFGSWLRLLRPGGPWVAPYVPTATEVARQLLSLARLAPGETMCDLGCGDGRMLHMAVHEFGAARAIGYELDTALAASARDLAAGDRRIEIRCEDFFEGAAGVLAEADVVALYLSETGNAQLLPLLCQHLRPSARVVSNVWEMPVPPSRTLHAKGSNVPLHLFERAALMGQT